MGGFLRIGEQIIRLSMGEVEDIEERLPVLRRSVPEDTGSAVLQRNRFMIVHFNFISSVLAFEFSRYTPMPYGFCFNTRSIGTQPMVLGRSPESAVMASISR